jgi:molybdopterin-synthase adenylyltransferase
MSPILVFAGNEFEQLKNDLLSAKPTEAAAILLCTNYQTPDGLLKVLVRQVVQIPEEAYQIKKGDELRIDPVFLSKIIKTARADKLSVFMTHTHPYAIWPKFSYVDDAGEQELIPTLQSRIPDVVHGALVLGDVGFSARLYRPGSFVPESIEKIVLNGAYIQTLSKEDKEYVPEPMYDRNVRAFGAGQGVLNKLKVSIVGLGGIGSIVAQQLAHLGVGNLNLIDFDTLETTNLNRVVGSTPKDVGKPKVEVAECYIRSINDKINIKNTNGSILKEATARTLLDSDFVFSCTDSHGSRYILNQLAYQYLIPVIDTGVRIDAENSTIKAMAGRVQMLASGLPCLMCGNLLNPEQVRRDFLTTAQRQADPYIVGHSEPQPAIISINSTLASLAVTMFLSAAVGLPSAGRYLMYLIMDGNIRRIGGQPIDNCVVCSHENAWAAGDYLKVSWQNESV